MEPDEHTEEADAEAQRRTDDAEEAAQRRTDDAEEQDRIDDAREEERGQRVRGGHELSFPIVAVGASAGGLEALEALVEALPENPSVALVVATHGAASRESHLAGVLGSHAAMDIVTVEDGMGIKTDHIYICPPGSIVEVEAGRFHVSEDAEGDVRHNIDHLFRSLAGDQGSRVVGVVLSGALSDGTLGIREIHGVGGITMAQEEATAHYTGMPGSAIASGLVDIVGSPAELAQEIARIGRQGPITQPLAGTDLEDVDEGMLDQIFETVLEATGVDFSSYKRTTLLRRLHRRMLATGAKNLHAYLDILRSDEHEPHRLHDESLIHVTSFFRDPDVYDALTETVFPELVENATPGRPIRIWVPGCATGEEVYSLAIALDEYLRGAEARFKFQVFGTDLSEQAVEVARAARYPENIEADVSQSRLRTYFVREDEGKTYRIQASIRSMCVFARQDILTDPPFSEIDLVSCRNLLIYLEPEQQERVAAALHYALQSNGFLVLGSAESTERFPRLFTTEDSKNNLYRPADVPTPSLRLIRGLGQGTGGQQRHRKDYSSRSELDLRREADEVALEAYEPPGVVIDQHFDVLQFRGETGPFISPADGQASLNLMRMAPPGLAMAVRDLVDQVQETGETAHAHAVDFQGKKGKETTDLRVSRLPPGRHGRSPMYLVSFEQESAPEDPREDTRTRDDHPSLFERLISMFRATKQEDDERVKKLETELEATRDYLQAVVEEYEATNEELRSANEEALSTNEELQSTNEELETAKEELQSTNEELSTLNDELRERNEELQRVNDDLMNLLNSVDIPIVIVGRDLRIRRFTPPAGTLLNLISGDKGRPLSDLKHPFNEVDLEAMIHEVLDSLQVTERTVEGKSGDGYKLRIHPYRTSDDKIDGAVLVFWGPG